MSTASKQQFSIGEYPEYEPLLKSVIEFFCHIKGHRINFMSQIDTIISELFDISSDRAGKFRKLYFPSKESQCSPKLFDECMNRVKISHFNFKRMNDKCNEYPIRIPDKTRNKILCLSSLALPVSEVLNEKSSYEIHPEFKHSAQLWMNELDKIMQDNLDLKAAIFMYLHHFRDNEFVWWLLATLSSIDEINVKNWIDSFSSLTSERPILDIVTPTGVNIFVQIGQARKIVQNSAQFRFCLAKKSGEILRTLSFFNAVWKRRKKAVKHNWMQNFDEVKARGVEDVLFICMDGVSGLEDGAKAIFPDVTVQRCIVHLIRNSVRYIPSKESLPPA